MVQQWVEGAILLMDWIAVCLPTRPRNGDRLFFLQCPA
jgi:hypothetical protein